MGIDTPVNVVGLRVVFADWLYCRTRTQILVLNVLGEKKMIYAGWPSYYGNWEWGTKYATKHCEVCPYCVSREDAVNIVIGLVSSKGWRRKWLAPSENMIQGLCVWGIHSKFLVSRGKSPRDCWYIKRPSPRNQR